MLNKRILFSLAKKEFLSYFNSSTGYILIVPFLLLTFFLYFRSAFISNQASLRPFFDLLPFILLLFAPAIAMRTFAQEQKNQTLELLYAHPIREAEVVVGKFLGSLAFFAVLLLTTISLPATTFLFSNPDPGIVLAQYLGALFVGGAFLAIGIAASALTGTQVSSFLLGAAVSFGFILIGFDIVLLALPALISAVAAQMAIIPHMNNISRGVLDLRDLLYFLTIIAVFLMVAIIKISQRLTVEDAAKRNRLNFALALFVGIGVIANILMYSYPVRLDLTKGRLFTLSKGTTQTIQQLPDLVTVSLYTSSNLPGQVETNVRKTQDILRDYQVLGKGKVKVINRNPDTNAEDKTEALENGIQQVQFNTLANNAFAVQAGYFGLTLQYGDKKEVIPYIENPDDLEYQLTRRIRKMTATGQQTIALYSPSSSQFDQSKSISNLQETLETQYQVTPVDLDQKESAINANALVVYGLESPVSATASAKIADYVKSGGHAVLLLDNYKINPQAGTASPYNTGFEQMLSDYGVKVNRDIVYDVRQNETIALSSGRVQYLLPYPFWIKALPANDTFPALSGINTVTLAWPNSFDLEPVENVTQTPLLKTSKAGGSQTSNYTIAPDKLTATAFSAPGKEMVVGAAVQKGESKVAVVGDSQFITDQFTQNNPGDLNFAAGLIDWAAADATLASISRKSGDNPVFTFSSASQAAIIQYTNLLAPAIIVAGFGMWYLQRRKRLARRQYFINH